MEGAYYYCVDPVSYRSEWGGDLLSFYGERLDEDYLFSEENVYCLRSGQGEVMDEVSGPGPDANTALPTFPHEEHYEQSAYYQGPVDQVVDPLLDYWFWDFVIGSVAGLEAKTFDLQAEGVAATRQLLVDELASGAGVLNYVGHAGLVQMAEEGLLRVSDVAGLPMTTQVPVMVGVSCLIGHFAVPGFPSVGEALVAKGDGGVIAAWLPAGLTINAEGKILNGAFLRALNRTNILGELVGLAVETFRAQGATPYTLQTTILLGDPALRVK